MYTKDGDVHREHIAKTIYGPACGTGGTLSVSEEYIRGRNPDAHLMLYGQGYNDHLIKYRHNTVTRVEVRWGKIAIDAASAPAVYFTIGGADGAWPRRPCG